MPPRQELSQSSHETWVEISVTSMKDRGVSYELTRGHIKDGTHLFVVVDHPRDLTLSRKVETPRGKCMEMALMDGSVNPDGYLRFPVDKVIPSKLEPGAIIECVAEFDKQHYSGLTVTEVISK